MDNGGKPRILHTRTGSTGRQAISLQEGTMRMDVTPLFRPLTVNRKSFPNRIVMPPMRQIRDIPGKEGLKWYAERSKGGVGFVIVEAMPASFFGTDLTAKNMKPLVEVIRGSGALAGIQVIPVTFERHRLSPGEIDRREIEGIVAQYRQAAEVCAAAGFDALEVHGAHGYILNQFFSPLQNLRTDDFGGIINNRMRFGLTLVTALRPVCRSADMLLLYRHTPQGEGYGVPESYSFAEALMKAGVDILDLSPSSIEYPGDLAAPFKPLGVPLIAVNQLNHVARALEVLNQGRADLVAIGRGLIADPEWPQKVKEGRFQEIVECLDCRKKCSGNLQKGIPIECVQWSS